jgi:lysophospholipase L1-like esterase
MTMAAVLGASLLTGGSASASVLVVGDSLTVGDGPYLERELAGTPVEIDAEIGRPSAAGVPILAQRLKPEHDVVVFDLGTNDGPSNPGELASSLAAARKLAAGRCLVVATINRPPERGVTVAAQNRVVTDFAYSTGAAVADWQGIVASDPSLLQRDGVHATPAGYALRALVVAQAIGECLTGAGGIPAPSSDVAEPLDEPSAPRKPSKPKPPPRRPARIDWSVVGAWGPVSLLGRSLGQSIAAATDGLVVAVGAFAGPAPEPVLGAPEE